MAILALIRHGLSQANLDGIVAGGELDSPLTETGRAQAREAASYLKGIRFDTAHSSTQQRAIRTMEEILDKLGQNPSVRHHEEFKERKWGQFEGTPAHSRGISYPEEVVASWFSWEGRPPGGEAYSEVAERTIGHFRKTIEPELLAGKNVLLVGHNGMLRTLRLHLEQRDRSEVDSLSFNNCEVRIYQFEGDRLPVAFHSPGSHAQS